MTEYLTYTGSLIKSERYIVSPYEVSKQGSVSGLQKLRSPLINNGSLKPFIEDYSKVRTLKIINGLGVTLGDSIIGISVLSLIKKRYPNIRISVVRPSSAPSYVEELYHMASSIIDELAYMPYDICNISDDSINVDMGNILFWKSFHDTEMHDFFMQNLGLEYSKFCNEHLNNSWLKALALPSHDFGDYVLFSPMASTSIRSIPSTYHRRIVEKITNKYNMKVIGFTDIDHPMYLNVSDKSTHTADYISIVSKSKYVYTCDTSAVHIAAGFDIPTCCVFTTIDPLLRTKYYTNCKSIFLGDDKLKGIQSSENVELLNHVDNVFKKFYFDS